MKITPTVEAANRAAVYALVELVSNNVTEIGLGNRAARAAIVYWLEQVADRAREPLLVEGAHRARLAILQVVAVTVSDEGRCCATKKCPHECTHDDPCSKCAGRGECCA